MRELQPLIKHNTLAYYSDSRDWMTAIPRLICRAQAIRKTMNFLAAAKILNIFAIDGMLIFDRMGHNKEIKVQYLKSKLWRKPCDTI